MNSVVEVIGLTRNYGKSKGIENISFTLHEGEIVGLLGPMVAARPL